MSRLIRLKEVIRMTGLSRSSIYAYIARGKFPAQIRISERCVAWSLNDLELWLDSCKNDEYFKYK